MRHPDSLDADEQLNLNQVLGPCPHLDALARHVTAFAELLSGRHGDRLDTWIDQVEHDELPQLRSLAAGLKRDLAGSGGMESPRAATVCPERASGGSPSGAVVDHRRQLATALSAARRRRRDEMAS